jgi:TonB-linked SusC/RagA family outer membrane protein
VIKKVNITGRVVNEKDEPVPGATVMVKGSTYATATDEKGEFRLEEIEDNSTLIISGVNIETYETKVRGRESFAVKVQTKIAMSEAVTVTVNTGYQNITKERATGSFAHVDNILLNRRVSPDILSRLEGIASGLLFDKRADNSLGISIRGRSTIFANTQPLIVIDNFPFSGDINTINPNDIDNITILKDAAAAAIWGARSGNGVIVITTKKGKYNKPVKLEINSNITISGKPDLSYNPQYIESASFIDVERFLFEKGFYNADLSNTVSFPVISPAVEIFNKLKVGSISQSEADNELNKLRSLDLRDDQKKFLYRNSLRQQYALNVSGGSEKTSYYLSAGYDKNTSNIVGDQDKRITLTFQSSYNPIKQIEIDGGVTLSQSSFNKNGVSNLSIRNKSSIFPYAQLADKDGNYLPVLKDYRASFISNTSVQGLQSWEYYPLREINLNDNESNLYDARITAGLRYSIVKGLNAEVKYQYQRGITQTRNIYGNDLYLTRNLINQFSSISNNSVIRRNIPSGSIFSTQDANANAYSFRGQASYSTTIGDHSMSVIAGFEANQQKLDGKGSTIYGYDQNTGSYATVNFDSLYATYPNGNQQKIPGSPEITPYTLNRFRSYFSNILYTYMQRYTLTGSVRMEQSNLFGVNTNQKTTPLWSVGLKWDIDKELFYTCSWLPYLKIRSSYGYNGNTDNSISAFTVIQYAPKDLLNNTPYAQIPSPGNPELRWEKIGLFNIGLDFQSAKNIISGSLDFFVKKGKDMIGDAIIPSSTGYTTLRGNYSNIKGHGIDLSLMSSNINKQLKWFTNFIFSYATDKVTKNATTTAKIIIEGRPVNGLYSYKWGGLDANGDPLGYLDDTISKNYSTILAKAATNPNSLVFNGPENPVIFGSIINRFSYKQFSFSLNITYKLGYYFRKNSISYSGLFNSWLGHADYEKRWQRKGDEAITNVPSMVYTNYPDFSNRDAFYLGSEINVEKADHIRLQDINLSYDFTKNKITNLPFQQIQLYVYMNNLGVIWKANSKGVDPEFQTGYPNPKSISIGLRATL